MNNKTIIEFGFRMMWRIMLISEIAKCLQIGYFNELPSHWLSPGKEFKIRNSVPGIALTGMFLFLIVEYIRGLGSNATLSQKV